MAADRPNRSRVEELAAARGLEHTWSAEIRRLEREEARLAARVADDEHRFAGLKNLDDVFGLVATRFSLALRILDGLRASGTPAPLLYRRARDCAGAGLALLEELLAAGISVDQHKLVTNDAGYLRAQELFQQLLLRGGGALFEPEATPAATSRALARIVVRALRKHAARDDTYAPLGGFRPDRLPRPLQRPARALAALLRADGQVAPPYGIEDAAEQELVAASRIRLPLSQAIRLFEEELLPPLRRRLAQAPGDARLQQEIARLTGHVAELRRLRFIPRSTPIVVEHGFYTQWLSGYTADGEALVSVPLRVTYRSGTNLDRTQELIKDEITRRAAGRGICADLDAAYYHLRSLESGIRGSSRTPGLRLNVKRGFQSLKQAVPPLARLEDRAELRRLLALVTDSPRGHAEREIAALLAGGRARPLTRSAGNGRAAVADEVADGVAGGVLPERGDRPAATP